jgi:hypothetical protein
MEQNFLGRKWLYKMAQNVASNGGNIIPAILALSNVEGYCAGYRAAGRPPGVVLTKSGKSAVDICYLPAPLYRVSFTLRGACPIV